MCINLTYESGFCCENIMKEVVVVLGPRFELGTPSSSGKCSTN